MHAVSLGNLISKRRNYLYFEVGRKSRFVGFIFLLVVFLLFPLYVDAKKFDVVFRVLGLSLYCPTAFKNSYFSVVRYLPKIFCLKLN